MSFEPSSVFHVHLDRRLSSFIFALSRYSSEQKVFLDKALAVIRRLPPVPASPGAGYPEEPAWKNGQLSMRGLRLSISRTLADPVLSDAFLCLQSGAGT